MFGNSKLELKKEYLDKVKYYTKIAFTFLLNFFTNPAFTAAIVLSQLIAGAMLGADVSIKVSLNKIVLHSLESIDFSSIQKIWGELYPLTRKVFIWVLLFSIMKSLLDALKSFIDNRLRNLLIEENRRLPDSSIIHYYHLHILQKVQTLNDNLVANASLTNSLITIDEALALLTKLASYWDGDSEKKYSANLMIHIKKVNNEKELYENIKKNWEDNKQFFTSNSAEGAMHEIDGILTVVVSYNSEGSRNILKEKTLNQPIENSKSSIILPVHKSSHSEYNIPGAPIALESFQPQYIPNTLLDISKWLNITRKSSITPLQSDTIYKYYHNDKTMRSLLSLPSTFSASTKNGELTEKFASKIILNLYSSNKYMLKKNPELFNEFCKPILNTITKAYTIYLLHVK